MTRNGRVFRSKGGIYIETNGGELVVYLGYADGWAAREYAAAILKLLGPGAVETCNCGRAYDACTSCLEGAGTILP